MPEAANRVRVWLMASTRVSADDATVPVYAHPWNWATWQEEPRLLWMGHEKTTGSMGSAQFQLLRAIRADQHMPGPNRGIYQNRGTSTVDGLTRGVVPGAWVAITTAADPTTPDPDYPDELPPILDPDAIVWWGYLHAIDGRPLKGLDDEIGTVEAREVGHLLDAQQVRGWLAQGASAVPFPLRGAPWANLEGRAGQVIGNAKWNGSVVPGGCHLFAADPADCGTADAKIFTRWRLLQHLAQLAWVPGLPSATIACADGSEAPDPAPSTVAIAPYLNDPVERQALALDRLTYKGVLDLLVPEAHALSWEILPAIETWTIRIASAAASGYGMPEASVTIDYLLDSRYLDLRVLRSDEQLDEVTVEGGWVRWCFSLSYLDGTFDAGYDSTQRAAYDVATPEQRASPEHGDVYVRFVAKLDASGRLIVAATPGAGGATRFACPELSWDGTTLSVGTADATPYLPLTKLLCHLPWPVGLKADGTDGRTATQKALPTYEKVRLYHYDSGRPSTSQWTDLRATRNRLISETPEIDEDDRGGAAMRIQYQKPHALGQGTFTGTNNDGQPAVIDWRKLVATVAIDSGQRLSITLRRSELTEDQVRRRLPLREERFQCWMAQRNTVLGVSAGQPTRVTVANVGTTAYALRNDWAAAQRYLNRVAAWGFRPRQAVVLSLSGTALPTGFSLGAMVNTIIDMPGGDAAAVTRQVRTAIRSIRVTGGRQPRVDITTDYPPMPQVTGAAGGAGPSSGGAVSPSLGATVPQAVAQTQTAVRALRDETRRRVVVPGAPAAGPFPRYLRVEDGNELIGAASLLGLKTIALGSPITSVPTAVPVVGTTYADGLSAATDLDTGDVVWIASCAQEDGGTAQQDLTGDLPEGVPVLCVRSLSVPISGGGGTVAQVWLPWRV